MKLSIITVNYNNCQGLIRTLDSVASQSSLEAEHIIIDAASSDGSVDAIHVYEERVIHKPLLLRWVSEKDNGIYDGMNKAINMAGGEYLLFLNSGDVLTSADVIERVNSSELFADVVIGSVRLCKDGKIHAEHHSAPEHLSLYTMLLQGIPHQASLIKKASLLRAGGYDTSYRISADWAFFMKVVILEGCSVQRISLTVCDYDLSGISSTQTARMMEERKRIFQDIFPARIVSDYESLLPHYYEVIRIQWLLEHPFFYRIYRGFTSIARRFVK